MRRRLKEVHARLDSTERLLIEYKPFEPAFYHTDIADLGMAFLLARAAGPQALVLVDTGHHYQTQNIEQIVAWLLHHHMLGGFHFNDPHVDDDLTLVDSSLSGFRIFDEIRTYESEGGKREIAYMVDQSHNLKGKIEAMIQTVSTAQELYAKAALVDHERLAKLQHSCSLVEAEECLRNAFWHDVRPTLREWRHSHGLPQDPMQAFREDGYLDRITSERSKRGAAVSSSYA